MTFERRLLKALCPMHVQLDRAGRILDAGPTLRKLVAPAPWEGRAFLDLFEVVRPRRVHDFAALQGAGDRKLHLRFRDPPRTGFIAHLLPDRGGGAVVNLSFGISVGAAVQNHALTSADFPPTDLTVEMLFVLEAKSAAMEASRRLNRRLQAARIAAEEQAFTDTLTGLKNRRAADHVLARTAASGEAFAVLHLDLDHFKQVNDSLGHGAGDRVLQHAAAAIVRHLRAEDTAARIGGDEFLLVLPGVHPAPHLLAVAQRLIADLEQPVLYDRQPCHVSASIGIAWHAGGDPVDPEAMIARADVALYAAKRAGRGRAALDPEGAADSAPGAPPDLAIRASGTRLAPPPIFPPEGLDPRAAPS